MSESHSAGASFRSALTVESPLQVVGAITAYAGLMAKRVGYKALYLSGGGVGARHQHGILAGFRIDGRLHAIDHFFFWHHFLAGPMPATFLADPPRRRRRVRMIVRCARR